MAKTQHGIAAQGGDTCALRSALEDWQCALLAFDSAAGALDSELAAIRLDEAARRFGCLSRKGRASDAAPADNSQ